MPMPALGAEASTAPKRRRASATSPRGRRPPGSNRQMQCSRSAGGSSVFSRSNPAASRSTAATRWPSASSTHSDHPPDAAGGAGQQHHPACIFPRWSPKAYWLGAAIVEYLRRISETWHVAPHLRNRPHPTARFARCGWRRSLGSSFEHLPNRQSARGSTYAEFLAINPNGRLPVIVDDEKCAVQSRSRSRSISPRSIPTAGSSGHAGRRGAGRQWSLWAVTEVDRGEYMVAACPCDCRRRSAMPASATRRSRSGHAIKVLDAAVSKRPLSPRRRFTVADLNVVAVISRAVDMDLRAHRRTSKAG